VRDSGCRSPFIPHLFMSTLAPLCFVKESGVDQAEYEWLS